MHFIQFLCLLIFNWDIHRYELVTEYMVRCKNQNQEVGFFNMTMLVSEEFGRSKTLPSNYYVSPDEKIYNVERYAGEFIYKLLFSKMKSWIANSL